MSDRTVHASCDGFEVVRYDRRGQWYVESHARGRERVSVREAAIRAQSALVLGGWVTPGLAGGKTFDRLVEGSSVPS